MSTRYLIGYDIGSSSVKVSMVEIDSGEPAGTSSSPEEEMPMISKRPGWAEQHPADWWSHAVQATRQLLKAGQILPGQIAAIGIAYQMHGLVAVDRNLDVLRPSIIWCDSRATEIGNRAFQEIGEDYCLKHFLNSPGNFTASKLSWVRENEPDLYKKIYKIMLPGDYIAMKMTGRICTTVSGLSEAIMWNYPEEMPAAKLLDYYGISESLLPEVLPGFGIQGELTETAAVELGLTGGTPVSYRSGDQPNNAYALNVLEPGEVAANAGTSGVIYGITDHPSFDNKSRVNTFVHVNHQPEQPRYGVLLCVNGTGILNSWLRKTLSAGGPVDYEAMNRIAAEAPIGSAGLAVIPFGNGAERILENRDIGSGLSGLNFNRHDTGHLLRAAQEGIVFALNYGLEIMKEMDLTVNIVRAGKSNMFLSPLFREAFVNTTGASLELYNTDGAQGAARGAGIGAGIFQGHDEAFRGLRALDLVEPDSVKQEKYRYAYENWVARLNIDVQP